MTIFFGLFWPFLSHHSAVLTHICQSLLLQLHSGSYFILGRWLAVFFLMILKRMKKKMCLQGNFCASQPWLNFFFLILNANQKALPYSPFIMFAREIYNIMIIVHTIMTSTSSGVLSKIHRASDFFIIKYSTVVLEQR